MKHILSFLCVIFLQYFTLLGADKNSDNKPRCDTISINAFAVDGIKIGDHINLLVKKWGEPYSYRKNRTAYDASVIYISTYYRVASFILNENENISDIDYVISPDVHIQLGDSTIHIGDDIAKLSALFPDSYSAYLNGNKRVFYLAGTNNTDSYTGFKFQFIIKQGLIICFGTYVEE